MPEPSTAITALGTAGSIAGSFGKGKSPQSVSQQQQGFAAMPQEVQEYMLSEIFPDIQNYRAKPFVGIPKRQIDETDTDPIFGSKRRVAYDQGIKEKLRENIMFGDYTQTSTQQEQNDSGLVNAFLTQLGMPVTGSARGALVRPGTFTGDIAEGIKRGLETGGITQAGLTKALKAQGFGANGVLATSLDLNRLLRDARG